VLSAGGNPVTQTVKLALNRDVVSYIDSQTRTTRNRQRFVIPGCDEGVKALKQRRPGRTVGPPYPPLDYSRF
jgi:hypothetical protein